MKKYREVKIMDNFNNGMNNFNSNNGYDNGTNYAGNEYNNVTSLDNQAVGYNNQNQNNGYAGNEYNNVTSLDNQAVGYNNQLQNMQNQNNGYAGNEYNNVTSLDNQAVGYNNQLQNMQNQNNVNNHVGSNDGVFQSPLTFQQQQMYVKPKGNCILWIILGVIQVTFAWSILLSLRVSVSIAAFITGFLTICFSIAAQSAKARIMVLKFTSRLRTAKILNVIGWIIIIVSMILSKIN